MKKVILIFVIVLLMMCIIVYSQTDADYIKYNTVLSERGFDVNDTSRDMMVMEKKDGDLMYNRKDDIIVRTDVKVNGLENAILRVKSNETVGKLELVLKKINEKNREKLSRLKNIEIESKDSYNMRIEGVGKSKLLYFIPIKRVHVYEIDNFGMVKKPFRASNLFIKDENIFEDENEKEN